MPWSPPPQTGGNLLGRTGTSAGTGSSYLTGGGVQGVGSYLATGGPTPTASGSNKSLNEFVTGPFIPSPAGANLTGTSSLQRAFPERVGGDLTQQTTPGQPSFIQQAGNLPANIAETPVAFLDTVTGGGLSELLKSIGDHTFIGGAVDAAGGAIQKAFALPAALMNSQPAMVMSKVYDKPDSTVIDGNLLQSVGLPPALAGQFKKNGVPILGWLGITGDQMTVGDLKKELAGRGFLTDPQGQQMEWSDVANVVQNDPLGAFQFGDKSVNESGVSDFLLQTVGQGAEIAIASLLTGGLADIPLIASAGSKAASLMGAAGRIVGIGERGAKALESAATVAEDLSGVGKIAKAAENTAKPFAEWAKNPAGKLAGDGWGVGAEPDLANTIVEGATKAITREAVSPAVAAEQIAAGNVASASLKGVAQYWLKKVLLPEVKGANLLERYYLGQTQVRAGLFGIEQVTGVPASAGIHFGPLDGLHDFTKAVLNDHPLSDTAVFQMATAFTFPYKKAVSRVAAPLRGPTDAVMGRRAGLNRAAEKFTKEFGPDSIEKIGGKQQFAAWMDRMRQGFAADRALAIMPDGMKAKIESFPEAISRLKIIGNATAAAAAFMERTGKITADDLVKRFRDMHENPIGRRLMEDGTSKPGPILPYRTKLSNETILNRAAEYAKAEQAFTDPFFGTQTAVLGRASRMTKEDLDVAVAAAQAAADMAGGKLDAQFVRDLFYDTPGMLDDPFLTPQAHNFAVEAMNPAKNAAYDSSEIIGLLKNLKDISPSRDELWHELTARDARAPVDPAQNGIPGGAMQNGVLRNIHSKETLARFRIEGDARVRALTQERIGLLDKYRSEFSKRGRVKQTAADFNWQAAAPDAMQYTIDHSGGTFDPRTGKPREYKKGYSVGVHNGTFATVAEGDAAALEAAAQAVRTEYPKANVGTWNNAGLIEVDPSLYFADKQAALAKAAEMNQKAIYDHATGKDIQVSSSGGTALLVPEPPVHFSAADIAAANTRRALLREQISKVTSDLGSLKSALKGVHARAQELRTSTIDPSFYTQDGSPRVHPNDVQRLNDLVAFVRENYPQWEVTAGPRLMNKYTPDENFIKNLMIEHGAIGQMMFEWGPGSFMSNAIETILRPVKGSREAKDTISRLYEVLMGLGAKQDEINNFLKYSNEVLIEGLSFGVGPERIPVTRGFQAFGANQMARQAFKAFSSNDPFMKAFEKRFGGKGIERMYVPVAEAYNPAVRAIQRQIEQGGPVGRFSRLFSKSYDKYHVGFTSPVASSTRMLAKFWYPLLRFTSNPLYHLYNLTEADIIGLTQDGLRVTHAPVDPALSSAVFRNLERGNPEAAASMREAQRRAHSLGINTDALSAGAPDIRRATIDQTGVTFGLNTRRATILERQIDLHRGETIMGVLKEFAKDDPAMQAFMKRFGTDETQWVQALSEDLYQIDLKGDAGQLVSQQVKKQGWSPYEIRQMQPITDQVTLRMQQGFDDAFQLHVGNINRSRLERTLNSYWLFWPASYMLKANKWMFNVLTDGAFGKKTNAGGLWTLGQLSDLYHQRYTSDPQFRKTVDDNADLSFMLSAILPVAPWSDGVSLNRLTRYVGGAIPLWPDYSNFDLWNVKDWGGKMSDIGPVYSLSLMGDVAGNLGKDFNWQFNKGQHKGIVPSAVDAATGLINGGDTPANPVAPLGVPSNL